MLSAYFKIKTKRNDFKDNVINHINNLKNKKIIIYGAGEGFVALNKQYNFTKCLNIIAIADKKFRDSDIKTFMNIKAIEPSEIIHESYDYILVSNEYYQPIVNYLSNDLCIEIEKIKNIFEEKIKDERKNLNYIYKLKLDKTLPKLIKKLRNKTVVLYGAGVFLEVINEYLGLKGLNIIAIADKKFDADNKTETFLGYPTIVPSDIQKITPDCVLISTKFYIDIFEFLTNDILKNTKIKVMPLLEKSFITLVKELWKI